MILGGLAFLFWRSYTQKREKEREQQQEIRDLKEHQRVLILQKSENEINAHIYKIEEQLKNFFWPIQLALKTDDVIWKKVPTLYNDESQLPTETGKLVEHNILIPNHINAVEIIQNNFHLIGDDSLLVSVLLKYIRHVAVFRALRLSGTELNPIEVKEPFPNELNQIIKKRLKSKQQALKKLKQNLWEMKGRPN